MKDIIDRQSEISILKDALTSQSAELIAVYGRLRVGKTHLIRTVYDKNIIFEFTGSNGAAASEQLENFTSNIQTSFQFNYTVPLAVPENWSQAFRLLIFITLLKTFGANLNEHYLQIIQNQLTMDVLFYQTE